MGREVTVSVWLSDSLADALAQRVAAMQTAAANWTEDRELASLIVIGLAEHCERQRRAVERARELAECGLSPADLGAPRFASVPVPAWLQELAERDQQRGQL